MSSLRRTGHCLYRAETVSFRRARSGLLSAGQRRVAYPSLSVLPRPGPQSRFRQLRTVTLFSPSKFSITISTSGGSHTTRRAFGRRLSRNERLHPSLKKVWMGGPTNVENGRIAGGIFWCAWSVFRLRRCWKFFVRPHILKCGRG